jgi:hypothetical protein
MEELTDHTYGSGNVHNHEFISKLKYHSNEMFVRYSDFLATQYAETSYELGQIRSRKMSHIEQFSGLVIDNFRLQANSSLNRGINYILAVLCDQHIQL